MIVNTSKILTCLLRAAAPFGCLRLCLCLCAHACSGLLRAYLFFCYFTTFTTYLWQRRAQLVTHERRNFRRRILLLRPGGYPTGGARPGGGATLPWPPPRRLVRQAPPNHALACSRGWIDLRWRSSPFESSESSLLHSVDEMSTREFHPPSRLSTELSTAS